MYSKNLWFFWWKKIDNSYFSLKSLIYLDDIKNNLVDLELNLQDKTEIEKDAIKSLNDFKVLENLNLYGFKLKDTFLLKLKDLKKLKLRYCENIIFENCCLNLKALELDRYILIKPKLLLKLPNLEECNLCCNYEINYNFIDFKSLNKLKIFSAPGIYFMNLENTFIEEVKCDFKRINDELTEKILLKLLTINSLKTLYLKSINFNIVSKIDGHFDSVTYISIENENQNDDLILDNLQIKFPNLSSLCIKNAHFSHNEMNLEIIENKNSKINDIFLDFKFGSNKRMKICCQSYETIKYFGIDFERISNLKEVLPIFNEKCDIQFKLLKIFYLKCGKYEINFDVLRNIYNNIDKMPNIRQIEIECFCTKLNEEFYGKFIEKILSLNLDFVYLNIQLSYEKLDFFNDSKYSLKELNEMKQKYPKFKSLNFNKIRIYKLKWIK